ncbi:MAG: ribonuclease III [Thermoleophilia bacterium]|jgi:ribonuclease-3
MTLFVTPANPRLPAMSPEQGFGTRFLELVRGLPPHIFRQALTHSSWVTERNESYERLEFLGDSVLGLAIAATVYERYPHKDEGELARVKAFVVSRASCAEVARCLDVPGLIMAEAPGPEQKRLNAAKNRTVLGNVLEALIGACYLVHRYDCTAPAVTDAFERQIEYAVTAYVDHKTALQELLAPRGVQPVYRLVGTEGPPHDRIFSSEVVVAGDIRGRGRGRTIKTSEQAAAQEALESLRVTEKGL